MRFEWDEQKNRQNLHKHDVHFETAVLVFDDPYAITQRDVTFEDEERWITVGRPAYFWRLLPFLFQVFRDGFTDEGANWRSRYI